MRLLPLFLGLALACCSSARQETSIFGDPLCVNGQRVTDDQIKLALIYGSGRAMIENWKLELVIEEELARQAREKAEAEVAALEQQKPFADSKARSRSLAATRGRMLAELHDKYRVSDEEFEAEYSYSVEDIRTKYPTLEIGAEICRAFRSIDCYREQLRQQMYFDRVFLPVNPADWPTTTIEAIRSEKSGGELIIPDAQESYKARLAAASNNNGVLPREDALMMTFQREMVRNAILDVMTFKTQPDGIDPKLALCADSNADGKPDVSITVDELWERIADTVSETEIAETKQRFITSIAVRDRLAEDGALLSAAEAKNAVAKWKHRLEVEGRNPGQTATQDEFFPSLESFTEYYLLREGYRRMVAPKLASDRNGALSPTLRGHLDRAARAMGFGMVDSEVLLVSAMDIGHFRWKKNGWTHAHRKAQALREEYDRDPTPQTWSRLMDANSEYWDPPPAAGKYKCIDTGYKEHGRFGLRYRNGLSAYVGESPCTDWVTGDSIADHIFFDQVEGTVDGPFRGPLGWYLTRVIRRTPPKPIDPADPKIRKLLEDDYLRSSFNQYTKEAVARAKVRGWAPL